MSFPITQYAAPNENEFVMNNLLKAFYGGQKMGQEARARPEMLAALLKKEQAQAPLMQAQTKQLENNNFFMDEYINEQKNKLNPATSMDSNRRIDSSAIQQALLPTITDGSEEFQPGASDTQGQAMRSDTNDYAKNVKDFERSAMRMKGRGFGEPTTKVIDGRQYGITHEGAFDLGSVGPSVFQQEFDKVLGKEAAMKLAKKEEDLAQAYASKDNLDLVNSIIADPEFKAMRQHPLLGKQELRYFENDSSEGHERRKYLIGQFKTSLKNLITQMSQQFKGTFRIGEQDLVEQALPNPGDTLEVMEGKAATLTYLNNMLTQRLELETEYQRKNSKASEREVKKYADSIMDPKEILGNAKNAVGAKEDYTDEDIAYTAKIHGMTEKEVRARLGR